MTRGQRFARLVTDAVVRRPALWRLFRRAMRGQFDGLAEHWDSLRSPGHLLAFEAALEALPGPYERVLDLGTGTGAAAFELARRYPEAEVVGVDLSEAMVAEAVRKAPPDVASRVRFAAADASRLPFPDASFELVTLANMIPFFDELARVTAPGGAVLFSFSRGPETPIYVPAGRLRRELGRRGFTEFADFTVDASTALLARRREPR